MSLAAALTATSAPGPSTRPSQLLSTLLTLPSGTEALFADHEPLFAAIEQEFPFISMSRLRALSTTEIDAWAGLLRWLISELQGWTSDDDPYGTTLLALLALTRAMQGAGSLWPSVAPLVANSQLSLGLDVILRMHKQQAMILDGAPQWELDLLQSFLTADQAMAWDRVDEILPAIMPSLSPPWLAGEAACGLAYFDLARLEQACAVLPSVLDVVGVISDLPAPIVGSLAQLTSNDRLRFVAVHQLASATTRSNSATEAMIADALVQVAADLERWTVWMRTFARYPIRFPALQPPLGVALATVGPVAQQIYLGILEPDDRADSRLLTAACLEAFCAAAPLGIRQAFWSLACTRWAAWDFAGEAPALAPVRSALDYALVGYALEVLTPPDLQRTVQLFKTLFTAIEQHWYPSLSDCITARNRAASRILPFEYAQAIHGTAQSWLDIAPAALPQSARSPYLDVKFRTR